MTPADEREEVILVDAEDRPIGTAPKLAAHAQGRLHRAISVQLRDPRGRLLLQKRHIAKYHSGGLWTNTCCSHPRPGEAAADAARRRLAEEIGVSCPLTPLFTTRYRAALDNGMTEHEVVHVFGGVYAGPVAPNPLEVDGFAWLAPDELREDVARAPHRYSAWFRIYLNNHWPEMTAAA